MQIHNLQQGSPEWLEYRRKHFNASDAPAMLGVSPYKSRSQLLHEMATGLVPEVDAATQCRFDDGHRFEALARPIAEELVEQELYPVTGSEGIYSASFDGLTMAQDIAFEHKSLNDALRKVTCAADLDEHYRIQMEQQLMVSGAEECLFMATKWDKNDNLVEKVQFIYEPDLELRQRIIAGWAQFGIDLATYIPTEIIEPPKPDPIKDLPAVIINANGGLSVCNLDEVTPVFDLFINNAKTELVTDEDFANGEETGKKSRAIAKTLLMKADEVIDQISTVGDAVRTLKLYAEKFNTLGLTMEKAVKEQKETIKGQIMAEAKQAYTLHIAALEAEIEPIRLVCAQPDFAAAMKNQRTLTSLHGKVNDALANAKITADAAAKDVRAKLAGFNEFAKDYKFLFNDLQQIITKQDDDFKLLVTSRIEAHKKAEADKQEADRKRIQAEEEAKARAKVQSEQEAAKTVLNQEQPAGAVIPPQNTATHKVKAQAAVVESQDDISLFLAGLNVPDKTKQTIRAYLVEFVKFQAIQRGMESIAA